jgi:chromosome segregation protein
MDIYLDKLELHGFKSFPDKTVIKMHKGITVIVGPNGCGKSNIVDSIFWVMGEQRIKNLRGENNEDLIFNGTAQKKPLGMTEVGAFFVKHNEQIYIARRYFRTGESKYILNEKYCRNKDIQNALYDMQLGEKKYFIFEQGSIDKLISLKPSEKRILIEEAAGILQYLERKKETANKLIIAEQNLENLEILTADKETRLKDLKNQVNYVRRYRQVKGDRTEYLKALLRKKYVYLKDEFGTKQGELEKLISHESVRAKEITALEKEILKLEEERWRTDRELKENQKNIFDLNRRILSNKGEIDKSKQRHGFLQQKQEELKKANKTNKRDIEDCDRQIAVEQEKIKGFEKELYEETADYEQLESKLDILNSELDAFSDDDSTLKSEISRCQSELSRFNNQSKDLERKFIRVENEINSKSNFVSELKGQVSSGDIENLEKKYQEVTQKYEEQKFNFEEVQRRHQQNKSAIDELKDDIKDHQSELKNLDNQKNKYLQIKKKLVGDKGGAGNLEHYGYLQDHLQADKEFHKSLENFYFEEMDAIILKNNEDAADSKLNKFLLGNEAKEDFPQGIDREEGFIDFIKNVYQVKQTEIKEFLKNGVLVEDLVKGIRIFGKYGVNVVTKDGQVITNYGILIRNRDKGILDVIEEIREIDKKKESLQSELEKLKQKLTSESEILEELTFELDEQRGELRRLEDSFRSMRHQLESLKKNRDNNLKRVSLAESEIKMLAEQKDKLQEDFEKAEEKKVGFEEELKSLNMKREAYLEDVKNVRDDISHTEKIYLQKRSEMRLLEEKRTNSEINIKSQQRNKEKLGRQITLNEQEILRLAGEFDTIQEKISGVIVDSKGLDQEKDELEIKIKSMEGTFSSLNNSIKNKSVQLSEMRRVLEDIKESKNKYEIELQSVKKDLYTLEDLAFKELNIELENLEADEEYLEIDSSELDERVEEYTDRLNKMRDSNRLNFSAESEYEVLMKDYGFMINQREDIIKSIEDMNAAIEKIDLESKESFLKAFDEIKENFIENFKILFEGGEAEITITDPENILETGLDIKAQPPGKNLQSLTLLSGGEKTLTSLAFLFAMFQYKPSPFCVFDEVDASLDEANIQRFLKFLHRLKEKTQFLIITHNFKTMEEADYIYGISMNEPGSSTVYSMKMTGKEQLERIRN